MAKIFLSYRRSDSAAMCDRIYAKLVEHFGKDAVFKDIDSIPLGTDFHHYIEQCVTQCAAMLVIIGPKWLTVANDDLGRRLDDPQDLVRQEIESGLRLGVHVIPIAVDGAAIPYHEHLPPSIQSLARQNGWEVHHDPYFETDMQRLLNALAQWVPPLVPGGTQTAPDALACPRCRQVDQVRKVTSVAASGTPLARRLAAPPHPSAAIPRPVDHHRIQPAGCRTTAVIAVSCLMFLPSIYFAGGAIYAFSQNLTTSAIVSLILSIAIALIPPFFWRRQWQDAMKDRQNLTKWQQSVTDQVPQWERAKSRWQQLYFCGRCDGIFLPAEHTSLVPTDQINTLLFRQE